MDSKQRSTCAVQRHNLSSDFLNNARYYSPQIATSVKLTNSRACSKLWTLDFELDCGTVYLLTSGLPRHSQHFVGS